MDKFEFCPALPGSWSIATQDFSTLNEESAHATVAALMGLEILEARIDRPDVDVGGQVLIGPLATVPVTCEQDLRSACYRRLLAVLAGPVFVRCWEAARWPLDESDPGDVGLVARYCRWLCYDVVDLLMAESHVASLLKDKAVGRALSAVGWALLEHGAIPGQRVEKLVADADIDPAVVSRALFPVGGS